MKLSNCCEGVHEAKGTAGELLKAIARVTERAYRRGFQHGVEFPPAKLEAVSTWRFREDYDQSTPPPGCTFRTSSLERLSLELNRPEDEPIERLFRSRANPEPLELPSSSGIVYFIQDSENLHIKIGHTASGDAESRRRTLQVGNPSLLVLLATIPGLVEDERRLHQRFADSVVAGEWFRATPELLKVIIGAGRATGA